MHRRHCAVAGEAHTEQRSVGAASSPATDEPAAALRGHLTADGKGDPMYEKILSKSLGRAEVLKLSPAQFEQAKADYLVAHEERLEVQPTSMHSARRKACTNWALPC